MIANIVYGLLALYALLQGYALIQGLVLTWDPYVIWLFVTTFITLGFYILNGFIKQFHIPFQVPNWLFNALVLAGGAGGAWIGRTIYKQPFKPFEKDTTSAVLAWGSILHILLIFNLTLK